MHHAINWLARTNAIVGGCVVVGLVALLTVSIGGRLMNEILHGEWAASLLGKGAPWLLDLGIGEVRGSYEILEAGIAFAIFCFLPICQFHGAHASVDLFTARLPRRAALALAAFWEIVLTACLVLITVQLFGGVQRYFGNGETTLFLQFPLWWSYAASFAAAIVACVVALYCAAARITECVTGQRILPQA